MDKLMETYIKAITKRADKTMFGGKDHDYNNGGIELQDYFPYGVFSALTFINKHLKRLESLYNSGAEPDNESIADNWEDLLNYVRIGYAISQEFEALGKLYGNAR
jgi:hypothetical protein